MTTITLIIALLLTLGTVFITGILGSRYDADYSNFFVED